MHGLTLKLQMQAIDVLYAYKQVSSVIASLKSMRESATPTLLLVESLGKLLSLLKA